MAFIVLIFGIVVAIGNNISQYWITSAAPEAPEFSNGLFLASGNLGVTTVTSVGGLVISGRGTHYAVLGGFLFLILSVVFILMRNYKYSPINQFSR